VSASNFDLNPVGGGTDPNFRIYQRLASIESRLAVLESKRDIIVEQFNVNDPGVSTSTFNYNWSGGRCWIIWGGSLFTGTTGGLQLNLYINDVFVSSRAEGYAHHTGRWPLSSAAHQLSSEPSLVLGTNEIKLERLPSGNWWAYGMIIEWPQA
jgi:hypothetical protein